MKSVNYPSLLYHKALETPPCLTMALPIILVLLLVPSASVASKNSTKFPSHPHFFAAQEPLRRASYRLSKPLIGDDGRVYFCLEKNLLAFESNGTIAWTIPLNYTCSARIAPVHGGSRKIYLVAENRVLKINTLNIGTSEPGAEVFFGPEAGPEGLDEVLSISVSIPSSCLLINIKKRGLFAYRLHGKLRWSSGPVIYQSGYRQGCRKNITDCYFTSEPVIDHCESSIYISNNGGELYALSVRSPHFKWVQDFSSLDKIFIVTAGNNGYLYVTVPAKALVLALDVHTGTVLWQTAIGPLSSTDCAPVVDISGWLSIGSLDGFLYLLSPKGDLKKFPKAASMDMVVQVSPTLDCSGYAFYITQTEMEGKISRTIGEYTYVSALKPRRVVFTLLVPATGVVYWSETYPGPISSLLSKSDLRHFIVDESILLAFVTASNAGNPLLCHSTSQKFASSCSLASPKRVDIYTGNEKAILLFLLLQTAILVMVAVLLRYCCIFWTKKKLQRQSLGKFLEKRRSLHLQKKAFDRTISELQQKAAEEAVGNEVLEQLGDLVRQREGIQRKLSSTYSLGRDRGGGSRSKSLLPLYDDKTRSFSFQSAKKGSVTIFHTLSDTSSEDSSSEESEMTKARRRKGKAKVPSDSGSLSDDEYNDHGYDGGSSDSRGFMDPLHVEGAISETRPLDISDVRDSRETGGGSIRRRTLSSTI